MKNNSDTDYERRAGIGVGASLGALFGTALAALLNGNSLVVILGTIIGAGLGAAVGSRVKSQAFQFLWIEYSREVARRFIFSGLAFVVLLGLSIYLIKAEARLAIQSLFLGATSLSGLFLLYTFGSVISQLDDLLRKILMEAFALGFAITAFIFLTLGLFSLIYPIRSDWLIAFIIMLASALLGRFVVAWKYR